MKKKIVTLIITMIILMCGCSADKYKSYPAYFVPIVQELEAQWETLSPMYNAFVMNKWWSEGEERKGICEDKIYTVSIGENSYTFDLKDYLTDSEEWSWYAEGVFQTKERTYIYLSDFNLPMSDTEDILRSPQIMLLDFDPKNWEDYQVTPFSVEPYWAFSWVGACYYMGDNIYIISQEELGAINLNSKQFYHCREEHSVAEKYAKEQFQEETYYMYFFNVTLEQDGVIVYSAEVSEADDVPPIGAIFVAFKDREPIAYMSVDFRADNFIDSIELDYNKEIE